jgi:hypothetical protein
MKINKIVWQLIITISFCLPLALNVVDMVRAAPTDSNLWTQQEGWAKPVSEKFGQPGTNPTDIRTITINIIKVFLSFMAVLFVILIILAGFKWMTSQGNEQKIEEARGQIIACFIGIMIILAAFIITNFVATSIGQSLKPPVV